MTDLAVELYGTRVGALLERRNTFDFVAEPDAVERFGVQSRILSHAVPLVRHPRSVDAAKRRNFFDELLPEGRARSRLAGNAKLAPDYTIGMLARYGLDVAGAVKIWDEASRGASLQPATTPIDEERVAAILAEVRAAPIGNTSPRRMSSLAGVQDKVVLARSAQGWAEPLDGYPSTHILKPVMPSHPSLIFDEEYGARIVQHLGLSSFETSIETFGGHRALVIERYDRDSSTPDGRLHQEDFNQILGMSGDGKYQDEGHPGLAAIAGVLRHADGDARQDLLRLVTASVATGNYDLHAKNISVLRYPDGRMRLAPAYDVVPQAHQGFEPAMALWVNGKRDHASITRADLVVEGSAWGLRGAQAIVDETLETIRDFVRAHAPEPGAHVELASDIDRFATTLLDDPPS